MRPAGKSWAFAALLAALAGSFWVKGVDQILARHEAAGVVPLPGTAFLFSAVVILLGRAGADGRAPAPPRLGG